MEAIQIEPSILSYYGLNESIIKKEIENMEKFNMIKVRINIFFLI
jgi:hypothetical protein